MAKTNAVTEEKVSETTQLINGKRAKSTNKQIAKSTLIAFCIALALVSAAYAEDEDIFGIPLNLPSSASIGLSVTENNAQNYHASIDYGLTSGARIFLTASRSVFELDSQLESTRSLGIGASNDPLDTINIGFMLDTWGDPDNIVVNSFHGEFIVNTDNFQLGLQPQLRAIIIHSAIDPNIQRETNGFGTTVFVEYVGWESWATRLTLGRHNYSRDLSLIKNSARAYQRVETARFFGLDLTSRHISWNLDYLGESNYVSFSVQRYHSDVDDSQLVAWQLSFARTLISPIDILVAAGRQTLSGSSVGHASAILSLTW